MTIYLLLTPLRSVTGLILMESKDSQITIYCLKASSFRPVFWSFPIDLDTILRPTLGSEFLPAQPHINRECRHFRCDNAILHATSLSPFLRGTFKYLR